MKLLNLGRELLQSVIPFVLAKVNRVSFGLLTAEECARAKVLEPTMPRSRRMAFSHLIVCKTKFI